MGEKQDPDRTDASASTEQSDDEQQKVWDELPPEVEYPMRPGEDTPEAKAGRREAWKKRSATGAILTSFALGLREVIEPNTNEPSIVLETSGQPPRDLPVEADLEDAPPRHSVVKIRPWLLEGAEDGKAASGSGDPVEDDGADQSRGS